MRLQGTRAGTQPRPAQRAVQPVTLLLGPNLPRAACKGLADLWDDRVDNEPEEHRTQRHDQAIGTCRECPVRADCLTARLTEPDLGNGVWGGQLFTTTRKCPCGNALPPDAKYCSEDCRTGTRDRTKPAERSHYLYHHRRHSKVLHP
jgi:hypothetical protein